MAIVLEIGHQKFLIKSQKVALAVLAAMDGAIKLDHTYKIVNGRGKDLYWPDEDRATEVTIKTINADQFFKTEPQDVDVETRK